MEANKPAVKLYKSVGFGVEGTKKDEIYHEGTYYDYLLMAIFNEHS
jgi:RimJ/RimL family protein N-acetyltransferase